MKRRRFIPWWRERYRKETRGYRRYAPEDIFERGLFGVSAFRALRDKLARDYLIFFRNLEKAYPVGEFRDEARAAIGLVISTVRLIDKSVAFGKFEKKELEDIVANVDVLNAQRDFFVRQAETELPLRERIERLEAETGISPEALNITEEIVRRGMRIERRRVRRRGVIPRRVMPRAVALGAELARGVGVAALGPFYPVAEMLVEPFRDIGGLLRRRRRRRELEQFRELFEPTIGRPLGEEIGRRVGLGALGIPTPRIGLGALGIPTPRIRRVEEKPAIDVLKLFFDKEAYRAKWTKELLQRIKEISRPREREEGLGEKLVTGLAAVAGAGLTAVVGAALPAVAGAAVGAVPILAVEKAYAKYTESLAGAYEALECKLDAALLNAEWLTDALKKEQKAVNELQGVVEANKQRWETRQRLLEAAPEKLGRDPFALPDIEEMKRIKKESTEIIREVEKKGISEISIQKQGRPLELAGIPVSEKTPLELEKQISDLVDIMKELSAQMKTKQFGPVIKEPGIGDPFDSADTLLNEYSSGRLTLAER